MKYLVIACLLLISSICSASYVKYVGIVPYIGTYQTFSVTDDAVCMYRDQWSEIVADGNEDLFVVIQYDGWDDDEPGVCSY